LDLGISHSIQGLDPKIYDHQRNPSKERVINEEMHSEFMSVALGSDHREEESVTTFVQGKILLSLTHMAHCSLKCHHQHILIDAGASLHVSQPAIQPRQARAFKAEERGAVLI
jgi:hypothetical protein